MYVKHVLRTTNLKLRETDMALQCMAKWIGHFGSLAIIPLAQA